jgi:hypothetical protein
MKRYGPDEGVLLQLNEGIEFKLSAAMEAKLGEWILAEIGQRMKVKISEMKGAIFLKEWGQAQWGMGAKLGKGR